jgi:Filamin/ABP280 repeat
LIKQVSPGGFFYWVQVMASAGSNAFTTTQTITTGNFDSVIVDIANGNNVFNSNCVSVHPRITQNSNTGTVTVTFNAPTAGTYFISIKYNSQSIAGKPAPSPTTTVHYAFTTTGVAGSTSGFDLVLNH